MTKVGKRPRHLLAAGVLLATAATGCQESGLPASEEGPSALASDGAISADWAAPRDLYLADLSAIAIDAAIDAAGSCPPPESPCGTDGGMRCSTLRTRSDCGGCGTVCLPLHATGTCDSGSCSIGTCDPGWGDCNGRVEDGCEVDFHADSRNCGQCGMVCHKGFGCMVGLCGSCCDQAPFENCSGICANGCEINLEVNAENCGACGHVCPPNTPRCIMGQCTH